jgi:hypothetical protein
MSTVISLGLSKVHNPKNGSILHGWGTVIAKQATHECLRATRHIVTALEREVLHNHSCWLTLS